jgi:hypothetical protein
MTEIKGTKPVARAADTEQNGGLHYAVERIAADAANAGKTAQEVKESLMEHILRCEAINAGIGRDVSAMRKDAFYGRIVLAVILAIQILGIENAWGVFKFIRGLK